MKKGDMVTQKNAIGRKGTLLLVCRIIDDKFIMVRHVKQDGSRDLRYSNNSYTALRSNLKVIKTAEQLAK